MKKLLSVLLAFILVFTISVSVAEEPLPDGHTEETKETDRSYTIPVGVDATMERRIGMDPAGFEMKGTWNTTTLFANVYYAFHNSTDFTPYIGAGAGLAFNYAGYTASYQGQDFASGDKYSTTFAWNVGAGCSYAFNENFALDVAYRYVSTGASSVDGDVQGVHYQIDSNPNGHEFTIGLRMTF